MTTEITTEVDWAAWAVASEIAYGQALQSQPHPYPNFIHMRNPHVPWGGDFNRVVGARLTDPPSFVALRTQVEALHRRAQLDSPNRYDIHPPALDETVWRPCLAEQGCRLETAVFFYAPTQSQPLPSDFTLTIPAEEAYIAWFRRLVERRGYYEEAWFAAIQPLQRSFVRLFRPYWLLWRGEMVGWTYCAHLGQYARLFEVEIVESFRGRGFGLRLLQGIRAAAAASGATYALLQSGESLRPFYEKAGWRECVHSSIIWRQS
jgi:GNAT superfamily N-acetyltransferase